MNTLNNPNISGTPVRRLGLSKRFSSRSPMANKDHLNSKNTLLPVKRKLEKEVTSSIESDVNKFPRIENHENPENSFDELSNVIEVWKTGCKEALIALQNYLRAHEDVRLSNKQLAMKLGIWQTLQKHFADDSQVVESDDESEQV